MESNFQEQTSDAHPRHKKWIEWTLILLLLVIVVALIQIYLVSRATLTPSTPVESTPPAASADMTQEEMQKIVEQVSSRTPADDEEVEVAADGEELVEIQAALAARADTDTVDSEPELPTSDTAEDNLDEIVSSDQTEQIMLQLANREDQDQDEEEFEEELN